MRSLQIPVPAATALRAARHRCDTRGTRLVRTAVTGALAWAALSGCASPGIAPGDTPAGLRLGPPRAEPTHGTATRQALAQQVLRPQASSEPAAAPTFDGVSAVHALTRQREAFKSPPASFGVLGIGSGAGQP